MANMCTTIGTRTVRQVKRSWCFALGMEMRGVD